MVPHGVCVEVVIADFGFSKSSPDVLQQGQTAAAEIGTHELQRGQSAVEIATHEYRAPEVAISVLMRRLGPTVACSWDEARVVLTELKAPPDVDKLPSGTPICHTHLPYPSD